MLILLGVLMFLAIGPIVIFFLLWGISAAIWMWRTFFNLLLGRDIDV